MILLEHHRFAALAILIMASISMGCTSSPKTVTHSEANPSIDFEAYETFAWISDNPMINDPGRFLPRNQKRIEDAIIADLTKKGFLKMENPDAANFTISYTDGSRKQLTKASYPNQYQGKWSWDAAVWAEPIALQKADENYSSNKGISAYTAGTLAIDIFDVARHEPAWHGYSTGTVTGKDRKDPELYLRGVVKEVLRSFPPKNSWTNLR